MLLSGTKNSKFMGLREEEGRRSKHSNLYQWGHLPHFQVQWYEIGLWRSQYSQRRFELSVRAVIQGTVQKKVEEIQDFFF